MFQYNFVPSTFQAFITVYPAVDCRHNSENLEKHLIINKLQHYMAAFIF